MIRKFTAARVILGVTISCLFGNHILLAEENMLPEKEISLYVYDKIVDTNISNPVRIDGRILVPAREVFESLGAEIEYKDQEKKVYIFYNNQLMILELNNTEVWLEGEIKTLDVPAQIINGKLMIPVRFVSEEFGFDVKWNEEVYSVSIDKPKELEKDKPLTNEDIEAIFPGLNLDEDSSEEVVESESNVNTGPATDKEGFSENDKEDLTGSDSIDATDEAEEDSLEEPAIVHEFKNLTYSNEHSQQVIQVELKDNVAVKDVKVTDKYMEKTIDIVLDKAYKDILENGQLMVNDEVINSITVQHLDTTVITINEKLIRSVSLEKTESGLRIVLRKPSDQYDKLLVLDTGHGGQDSGAIGIGKVYEKEVNFSFLKATLEKVEKYSPGVKIYVTRGTDVFYSLQERVAMANEIGADAFVSLHSNSAGSESPKGAEVLYFPSTTPGDPTKDMAQIMQDKLVNIMGMKDRGVKPRPDLYVLRNTHMPSVLLEVGFITNQEDITKMLNAEYLDELGKQIAIFISEIFELDYFSADV